MEKIKPGVEFIPESLTKLVDQNHVLKVEYSEARSSRFIEDRTLGIPL